MNINIKPLMSSKHLKCITFYQFPFELSTSWNIMVGCCGLDADARHAKFATKQNCVMVINCHGYQLSWVSIRKKVLCICKSHHQAIASLLHYHACYCTVFDA